MKKVLVMLVCGVMFLLTSCGGGPKSDAKKAHNMYIELLECEMSGGDCYDIEERIDEFETNLDEKYTDEDWEIFEDEFDRLEEEYSKELEKALEDLEDALEDFDF